MNWTFHRRHITSVIAALALLWAALAPAIGWALGPSSGDKNALLAVCSSTGLKYVKAGDAPNDRVPTSSASALDCPYCQLIQHWGVLPDTLGELTHPASVQSPLLAAISSAPVTQKPWRSPPSHAPPL